MPLSTICTLMEAERRSNADELAREAREAARKASEKEAVEKEKEKEAKEKETKIIKEQEESKAVQKEAKEATFMRPYKYIVEMHTTMLPEHGIHLYWMDNKFTGIYELGKDTPYISKPIRKTQRSTVARKCVKVKVIQNVYWNSNFGDTSYLCENESEQQEVLMWKCMTCNTLMSTCDNTKCKCDSA